MITIWYKIKTFVVGLKIPDTQYGSTGTACSVVEPEPPRSCEKRAGSGFSSRLVFKRKGITKFLTIM